MSREIKFREPMKCKCGQFRFRYSWWDGKWSWPNFMPVADVCCKSWHYDNIGHIEQYTGLKDKNGAEIYGGDIMKSLRQIGVVKQKKGCWIADWVKRPNMLIETLYPHIEEGEVIGNRHQHPQLLEQP